MLYVSINELECSASLIENITSDGFSSVFHLAKKHDLAHIVSKFVYQNKLEIKDDEFRKALQQEEILAVYRHERMKCAYEQICSVFDEEGIPYVPLKGAVIRPYYPYEHMRTSCDIDILIHEENLDCAIDCLVKKGYRCENRNYHDVSLYSPNKTHLELHFNIQENMDSLDEVLKDAWKHTVLVQGSKYAFSKEFFVFHMYAHMAYHFLSGGCGIRPLLDLWIMEHKMEANYSCAEDLLKKAGIYTFAVEMSSIANKCFTQNERDSFSDLVLKYICSGGIYGTKNNKVAIKKTETKSSFVYALERLFLPYHSMTITYPVLKKQPWLLPFFWFVRWVCAVFKGKTKKITAELSYANNVSKETMSELVEIRSRLNI